MKRIVNLLMVLVMCISMSTAVYAGEGNSNKSNDKFEKVKEMDLNIRTPETVSKNRIDVKTGDSIDDKPSDRIISPQIFMGYDYIRDTSYLGSRSFDNTFGYIYGTSITFIEGTKTYYELTVTRSTTKSTSWNVSGGVTFPVKVVEAEIKGGYSSTAKATVSRGENYRVDLMEPGSYDINFYMRGHSYPVYGKAKIMSTGGDHGNVVTIYLGRITFPTDEIAMDVS